MTRRSHLLRTALASLLGLALAGVASAQTPFPVSIENDESAPVPVFPAGRIPYQFTADVSAPPGQEDCQQIRVPEGMTLTILSVGVDATAPTGSLVDVFVRTERRFEGGISVFRYGNPLTRTYSDPYVQTYKGIFALHTLAGPADSPYTFSASACTFSRGSGWASARFVVSGYVEPTMILDGNSLPDPDAAPPAAPRIHSSLLSEKVLIAR